MFANAVLRKIKSRSSFLKCFKYNFFLKKRHGQNLGPGKVVQKLNFLSLSGLSLLEAWIFRGFHSS